VVVSRSAALVLALVAGTASAAPKRKPKSPDPKDVAAKQAEAKQHVDAATAAHAAGKLDVALTELRAAYELDPQPDLLFAMGQVQAGLGDCTAARDSYEQYRAAMNSEAGIGAAVDAAIAACGASPPPPTTTTQAAPPAPAPAGVGPWYTDVIGDVLTGGGAIALATAGLEYRSARSALDDAEHATTLADYNKLVDSAHSDRTFALVLGGAGAALVAGGIVHYMMHGKTTETRGVAIVPMAGGGSIVLSGTFSGGL
jgi:hypothetical protein